MDPVLADGERTPRAAGPLAWVPAGAWWTLIVLAPVALLLSHLAFGVGTPPRAWQGRAQRVLDGDTLVVWQGVYGRTLRLADVDCPEKMQPGGADATAAVRRLVRGQLLAIQVKTHDKYGRLVAEVTLPDGRSLSEVLLEEGHAWFNHRYSDRLELVPLEAAAKEARRGLWGEARPVPPWKFRHSLR